MFGLTEFNIIKEKNGWRINLVTGKKDTLVLVGRKLFSSKDKAYSAAELLWKKLKENEVENGEPVRYA